LWSDLFALRRAEEVSVAYLDAFVATARRQSLATLAGVTAVPARR
jgi:hypothetical protein